MSTTQTERKDLSLEQIKTMLGDMSKVRAGVIGDFFLDVYWFLDPESSEPSLETGLATRPVGEQRLGLGGAGNIARNLKLIGCKQVEVFGVVGDDLWGREMQRIMAEEALAAESLLVDESGQFATLTYLKPYLKGEEESRYDFGNTNELNEALAKKLVAGLEARLDELDVVIVNEQARRGIHGEALRRALNGLIQAHPDKLFIADCRNWSTAYPNAVLRVNDYEAMRLIGEEIPLSAPVEIDALSEAALKLQAERKKPVFITRGAKGVLVCDADGLAEVKGIQIIGRIDPVGAGDALLAGLAASLGAEHPPYDAAQLGNLAASISVQKVHQTGGATPEELTEAGADIDHIYNPDLAEQPRKARWIEGTEFEQVTDKPMPERITHMIFDHDGTISTLREGWEQIMEPMMVKAILGPKLETADDALYRKVVETSREFIDKTTGIQTLIQMQGLARLVRDFGCVPEDQILDAHGYKKIYNDELIKMVNQRLEKFQSGELSIEDYTMKNAVALLEAVHAAGVKLYMASGTDEEDVKNEAEALGYAHLFDGHIYGSVGDVTKDAKKIVLERILREIGPEAMKGCVVWGDGPVELRETVKRGGYGVGLCSDEVRRFGWNAAKRSRLIRGGADMLVPDFSQIEALLEMLRVKQ